MSDNKFILQLKGTQTPKSVVEIKNDKLVAPFTNVPNSTDVVGSIIDDKGSSVVSAQGARCWKLNGGALVAATNLVGDGSDYTSEYNTSGNTLWVSASYVFASPETFNPTTKWVLQLYGKNLLTTSGDTIDFTFIVKIGSNNIMTKNIKVAKQANFFYKQFLLDFSETAQTAINVANGDTLKVQLLCADAGASATIYNGMSALTVLNPSVINNPKITFTQAGTERGSFTLNQTEDATINLLGDEHNLGWYATQTALTTAHPTAEAGDWAIVGSTDTVWVWDTDTSAWVDSDQKGQVTSVNGQTGAVTVQETLVNQTNIKSVNNNSLLGAGNLELSTYLTYPNSWPTTDTTKAFCDAIAADTSAVVGKAYLGEVTLNDMPSGISNAEIVVEIMDGTTAANKVIKLTLTSGNVAPYMWIYSYWNAGNNISGWQTWQVPLVSGTNIKTVNNTSLLGGGDITIDSLPTQTGHSGEYLTTNGSTASWSDKPLVNEATPASSLGVGYTTINTTYNDSINIGNASQVLANNAIALGAFASAEGQDSIAIYSSTGTAHRARTTHTGNIAIGYNALAINAAYTIAIGYNAFAQSANAIQLGTGQNSSSDTMQVWTYKLLDKTTGIIPSARLANTSSATQGQVLSLDANLDAMWTDADYVVAKQDPTALNDYTWYRKYKSGWVEQGGVIPVNTTSVVFPVEFANAYASIQVTARDTSGNSNAAPWNYLGPTSQTSTGFSINGNNILVRVWEAKGYAA